MATATPESVARIMRASGYLQDIEADEVLSSVSAGLVGRYGNLSVYMTDGIEVSINFWTDGNTANFVCGTESDTTDADAVRLIAEALVAAEVTRG